MPTALAPPTLFPTITPTYLLFFQFSSWYPTFSHLSIKSTIIRPLTHDFCEYLDSDGVYVPEGSEDLPAQSTLSDDDDNEDEEDGGRRFSFPELDAKVRKCIKEYGAIFPKLNFSSPKDASWILPASSPLKCTSPADIYLLLKSSDFVSHDLSKETVFEGCGVSTASDLTLTYELELVLRKWYPIDRSRELRCFVRQEHLLGISQRDPNYYEYLNESSTQDKVTATVKQFWETNVKGKLPTGDYIFDILLTRDLSRAHILDFNPYAPRTDPLLFSYDDLLYLLTRDKLATPRMAVIDSHTHPAVTNNAPANQHNMIPFEALSLSSGRDIQEFADLWQEEIKKNLEGN